MKAQLSILFFFFKKYVGKAENAKLGHATLECATLAPRQGEWRGLQMALRRGSGSS